MSSKILHSGGKTILQRTYHLRSRKMTDGDLPAKAQELVEEWLEKYWQELQKMWDSQIIEKLPPI
jgi:hypothetical protein